MSNCVYLELYCQSTLEYSWPYLKYKFIKMSNQCMCTLECFLCVCDFYYCKLWALRHIMHWPVQLYFNSVFSCIYALKFEQIKTNKHAEKRLMMICDIEWYAIHFVVHGLKQFKFQVKTQQNFKNRPRKIATLEITIVMHVSMTFVKIFCKHFWSGKLSYIKHFSNSGRGIK